MKKITWGRMNAKQWVLVVRIAIALTLRVRGHAISAHGEQEIEPVSECDEEDVEDIGLGLPVILGIIGAALVGVFAFGAIFFACSRRRTATKAVLGAGGVVVMGQAVSASTPNCDSNKKGNAPEELAHDNV